MNEACRRSRSGFTLVELMIVVLIIGMLMALLLPAVNAVQISAKNAAIKIDLGQIANAMVHAKTKFDAFPPDPNWSARSIRTFFHKAFPRYRPTDAEIAFFRNLSEAEVLVFWLGGRMVGNRMTGFPASPTVSPFQTGGQRHAPIFAFEESRLFDADGDDYPEYYPPGPDPKDGAPYVYFAARNGVYVGSYTERSPAQGIARPYYQRISGGVKYFIKPSSFQIIHAGLDNHYGEGGQEFPSGIIKEDQDNITNFGARTLGDSD